MKKTAAKKKKAGAAPKKKASTAARRADFGAPVDAFFAKQKSPLREVLDALRTLVEAALPDAEASLKWGMPFYTVNGKMAVALGGHKAHVNLILSGDPESYPDPKGLLEDGEMMSGRRLKLTKLEDLPVKDVKAWLKVAAKNAKG